MKILDAKHYYKVQEPLNDVKINTLFARTVIDQKAAGKVYVDNYNNPKVFYIAHFYGMSLLFGETDNEDFNKKLMLFLTNKNKSREKAEWLQVYPNSWGNKIDNDLGLHLVNINNTDNQIDYVSENPGKVLGIKRLNFCFNPEVFSKSKKQLGKHENKIERTNEKMFNSIDGNVIPKHFWNSAEEFDKDGVGFSIIINGEAVATAFSAFRNSTQLELGIETKSDYRGRGFAFYTSSALIDYCIKNNLEPVWSCSSINRGSYRLAEKLGFVQTLTAPYYILPFIG